jgi:uncharacterized protein
VTRSTSLALRLLPERYAVCQLEPETLEPSWMPKAGALVACVRTASELSIVCDEQAVPADVRAERGFRVLAVLGWLPFDAIGVLAGLSTVLAAADIPLLAISTFDTDYLLVRDERIEEGIAVLRTRGYEVHV